MTHTTVSPRVRDCLEYQKNMNPIGLLGGAFDPIHNGHLILAQTAYRLLGLSQVLLIPNESPPHRASTVADFETRCVLIEMAIADTNKIHTNQSDSSHASIESIDLAVGLAPLALSRADKRQHDKNSTQPNFTYDLLLRLRAQHPQQTWVWLMGLDAFIHLPSWYRWQEIINLCHIVVLRRDGQGAEEREGINTPSLHTLLKKTSAPLFFKSLDWPDFLAWISTYEHAAPNAINAIHLKKHGVLSLINTAPPPFSSTAIRLALSSPCANNTNAQALLRDSLSESVRQYVLAHKIYHQQKP